VPGPAIAGAGHRAFERKARAEAAALASASAQW
jgi:hypothetical protein